VVASHKGYASALVHGAKIGPADHFIEGPGNRIEHVHTLISYSHYEGRTLRGDWGGNPKNRYLGVKFLIKGKIHYGWIRLTVITQPLGMTATITGYAYETVANKAITAGSGTTAAAESEVGSPAAKSAARSLGMLAAGVDGLSIWRRQ
jgi:hypothetical protein